MIPTVAVRHFVAAIGCAIARWDDQMTRAVNDPGAGIRRRTHASTNSARLA